ncbi:hypothetical protein [uncultured Shimia sp.]|uniref:hypothetical protein n=1 Tax=uncultured Shimia sp. TaxID=573152 RepID=UPI00260A129E|nr:hypothetical protein [uncultured Shimia sp.]
MISLSSIRDVGQLVLAGFSPKRREQQYEQKLLNNMISRARAGKITPTVFTAGYYHTGTRWVNELIRTNTPSGLLYSPRNQHRYIDEQYRIAEFGKHGRLNPRLLGKDSPIIIYMVRDFETWVQSFLNNPYDVKICDDIASSSYGWPSLNVYDLYCHVTKTNISLLRESSSNFIIANLASNQKTKGFDILELLEQHGVSLTRPFSPILKHTKTRSTRRTHFDVSIYKHHTDTEFETLIANSEASLEYKFH